jgi:hypothetical protein
MESASLVQRACGKHSVVMTVVLRKVLGLNPVWVTSYYLDFPVIFFSLTRRVHFGVITVTVVNRQQCI